MFYLNEFFKSLGESVFRGFSFLLFSCLLAFSLTHRPWITQTIAKISPEKMVNPYFVAVVDSTIDATNFKKMITRLPGVINVLEKDQEASRGKIQALVSQLGNDYQIASDMMNFRSVRVALNSTLSPDSLDFVRDQVVKAGGSEHVTATEVKYPEISNMMKTQPFYLFLAKAGDWGVVGLLAFGWMITFWLCYDVFRSRSYLIEKFQRKKLVAAKVLATGLSIVVVGFMAMGLWNGTLKFFDTILLLMVFSVFWTFSMQEWRWKSTL